MPWNRIFQEQLSRGQLVDTGIGMSGFFTNAIVISDYTNLRIQQWGGILYQDTGADIPGALAFDYSQILVAKATVWRPDRVNRGDGQLWIYVSQGCPFANPVVEVWSP